MTPSNQNILVTFEPIATASGLIIPERYLIQDDEDDGGKHYGVVTDRKLINPQVCRVVRGGQFEGERVFVYYGAYEIAQWVSETEALIPERTVFFVIDGEALHPVNDIYLGQTIWEDGEKTASGIYTTPNGGGMAVCRIRITHVPENSTDISVGDVIITIDNSQYILDYGGVKHVKVSKQHIIGMLGTDGIVPVWPYLLVDDVPEPNELAVDNSHLRSFVEDFRIQLRRDTDIGDKVLNNTKECTVLSGDPELVGKRVLTLKHGFAYNGRRIIDTDTMIGVICR